MDNEKENIISKIISESEKEKENRVSKTTNENENRISKTTSENEDIISENENIISENDKYERQVKKNRPCHSVWGYFLWNEDFTNIICNICKWKYSPKSGVSIVKGHFMNYHKSE
ncbi:11292_t:CDS:1 [Cetraspora pellucida]|uniref:11292_t:CDS:1 n=1 Tax=Cetraspora pellucida TaxID=1433469 RepID=A0ACA9N3U5_9GLOM|nr:11292_t:CDS:1 [Cetraspora pellucida]